jgi:hypothetical protein
MYFLSFLHNPSDVIFSVCAIIGTLLFALRILMSLFSGAFDSEIDLFENDEMHVHHESSTLKIFSLHSLSGFFMTFGLVGLGCSLQYGYSPFDSFYYAFLADIVIMLINALIFHGSKKLHSPGDNYSIEKTVGLTGVVYQAIPSNGQGKIQLIINETTREILAQSSYGQPIESFCSVKIVKVINFETVEVTKI